MRPSLNCAMSIPLMTGGEPAGPSRHGADQPELTTADAMQRLASVPLGYQPGTSWEYSLATDVLGAVIEKVTGASLGAFVTERVARPLRIQNFVFNAPENIRSKFVQVTRPAEVTGALGTGYVPVVGR